MSGRCWSISRRALLSRLGLGLGCLPLLRATRSSAAPAPKRFVCVMQPFAYRAAAWLPAATGPIGSTPLPDSSSPLQPFADALIFLPGLTNPGLSHPATQRPLAYESILTGVGPMGSYAFPRFATPTVDQVVASSALSKTADAPLRSMALGVLVDVGRATSDGRRCFWRGPHDPVAPEQSPQALFAAMFTRPAGAEAAKRLRMEQRSLLDYVGVELQAFSTRLGTEDRLVVERHLASIREIEGTLGVLDGAQTTCAPALGPALDSHRRANFVAIAELQMKLLVAALNCDLTRVATLQLANALGSQIPLGFIPGIRDGADWGTIALTPPSAAAATVDRKRLVDKWVMGLFAKLLGMLATGPAGATLLDQTVVLWGTPLGDVADGNLPSIPWLLAGKCGGYFKTGQVADSVGKPVHGVLAEICNAMGAPVEFFGDRALGAPLAGLKA